MGSALEIIHNDPDAGTDLERPPGGRVRCERGCYDCLLSYSNQYEHTRINRHSVVELLTTLLSARVEPGAGGKARGEQADCLTRLSDSSLEGRFVAWLTETGRRRSQMTSSAQSRACVPDPTSSTTSRATRWLCSSTGPIMTTPSNNSSTPRLCNG